LAAQRTSSPLILSRRRGSGEAAVLEKFPSFVAAMKRRRFKPVLQPALELQAAALGIPSGKQTKRAGEIDIYGDSFIAAAEVFVKDGMATICIVRRALRPDISGPDYNVAPGDEVNFHLYACAPSADPAQLSVLADQLHKSLGVETIPVWMSNSRFDALVEEGMEPSEEASPETIRAAEELADPASRSLAIALKTSGGLLLSDVPKQLPSSADPEAVKESLNSVGLTETETVVICRRTSRQVARAPSADALARLAAEGLRCACGAPVMDERTEDALTTSDRGQELLDGSRWMSVLLVEELEKLGVKRSHIAIEQTIGGDELDCVAVIGGALVLFELKDKEFNLGNAYSFGAKISLIRPDLPVIITSEHVGGDAKDHFSRIQAPPATRSPSRLARARASGSEPSPLQYIEGLENLAGRLAEIRSVIDTSTVLSFLSEVLPLGALSPPDVLRQLQSTEGSAAEPASSRRGRPRTRSNSPARRARTK
jgi:hypothetical protein